MKLWLSPLNWSLGVELGSWQSVFVSEKQFHLEPTMVAFNRSRKQVVAVGKGAKKMWGKTPSNISVIQPVRRGGIIEPQRGFSFLENNLSRLYLKPSFKSFLQLDSSVYVSYSPHLSGVERRFLGKMFHRLSINRVYLIDKLLLSLVGMGLDVFSSRGYLLLYIGGGTSYITLFSLGGKVFEFYFPLGGEDITNALVTYLKHRYNLKVGWTTMEKIKKKLTENERIIIYGYDMSKRRMETKELKREELGEVIFSVLSPIITKLRFSFNQIPPEFVEDVNRSGLFLAGGGSLSFGLVPFLTNEFKINVNTFDQPQLLSSKGLLEVMEKERKYQNVFFRF